MCTVTFFPGPDTVFLCSNRDEQLSRPAAAHPAVLPGLSGRILYPKDGAAGGTWVAVHANGNVMILLNGARTNHMRRPPYRKSRGHVFLDIFDSTRPAEQFLHTDLQQIEPFTLVLWQQQQLFEAHWDGQTADIRQLPNNQARVWSSATIYDEETVQQRARLLWEWQEKYPIPSLSSVLEFHRFEGLEKTKNRPPIRRKQGPLQTVSITAIASTPEQSAMHYSDLRNGTAITTAWIQHDITI